MSASSSVEEKYRALVDSIDQGYCVVELLFDDRGQPQDYRFLEVNPAFERLTGLVGALGQCMRTLAPTHEQHWFDIYGAVAATGRPVRFEQAAEALGRWYDVFAFRIGDPAARQVAILFSDITVRRRQDASLRDSEELFRELVQGTAQAVWQAPADGVPAAVSPSWGRMTGQSAQESSDQGWLAALHPDDRERIYRAWRDSVRTRTPLDVEYRIRMADGSYRWTNDRAMPLLDAAGAVRKWIGMNIDITERKRAEEDLQQADRRKDEFLAILAHELRNPLAPLRTGLDVMELVRADPARVEQIHAMMRRQVDHLAKLVDDLLDVSRISRGQIRLERRHLDLAAIVRAALEACDPIVRQRGHEIAVSLPPEGVTVHGDAVRLTQALSNLVTNAAKYTEPGGRLAVGLKTEDGRALLCVKDNGIGIPPAMLPRIFEPFVQVEATIDRAHGGLGIGLTLVRQLVELHGGSIEAHSEGVGRGSEFVIRLPLAEQPADDGTTERARLRAARPRRILVVDDNRDAAETLATMLQLLGHDTQVAIDGSQALALGDARPPDVVLMDVGMPTMNGFEAATRMRQRPWGAQAVLIAVTGWGQDADRAASQAAGFDHHLVKPVELPELERLVERS